jgi:phosphohistidine swiveling domain-containing protein
MGVLSIQDKGKWMSFLPKSVKEKTLLHGKELYTSKEKYTQYKKEFDDYIKESTKYFESVISKEKLSGEDIRKFFELASKHFYYYSQTEFFYTDLLKPEDMAISVKEFDKLKLDGRSHLNKILFEEEGYVRKLIKNISKTTGVAERELMNHSVAEIIDLVANAKKTEKEVTEKRDTFFSSHALTLVWDEARHLIDIFFAPYQGVSDEIRGTIANKGKVRGKARVMIPDFSNFEATKQMVEEMQEGEILVAETTAPEIIQACHKAIAIVTNQGGMLSHAAIISRELNIPCIIGTDKEVTVNIKTGDEIEVDANEGVVRIIK